MKFKQFLKKLNTRFSIRSKRAVIKRPTIEVFPHPEMDPLPDFPQFTQLPVVKKTYHAFQFSMNTDGSGSGKLSKSHQAKTATGISNGGEILGFTIPLDKSLKKIKVIDNYKPEKRQAAILTFSQGGHKERLLAVGNDTGGRHCGSKYKRGWGEFGVNTWKALKTRGFDIKMKRNSLTVPKGLEVSIALLDEKVSTVKQYRDLETRLKKQGRL